MIHPQLRESGSGYETSSSHGPQPVGLSSKWGSVNFGRLGDTIDIRGTSNIHGDTSATFDYVQPEILCS